MDLKSSSRQNFDVRIFFFPDLINLLEEPGFDVPTSSSSHTS